MKVSTQSLQNLVEYIDQAVDSMVLKIADQDQEINSLKLENEQLRSFYARTREEIKQYIVQLEQIKSQYVNSNNNS